VCADAMVKANRYRFAGRSSSQSQLPTHGRFLGGAHRQVWQLHARGSLPICPPDVPAQLPAAGAVDDEQLELEAHAASN
jgi:hypothetical protein